MRKPFVSPRYFARLFSGSMVAVLLVGAAQAEVWTTSTVLSNTSRAEEVRNVGFGYVKAPGSNLVLSETIVAGFRSSSNFLNIYTRLQGADWNLSGNVALTEALAGLVVGNTEASFEPTPYALGITNDTNVGNSILANFASEDPGLYTIASGQAFEAWERLAVAVSPSTQSMAVLYNAVEGSNPGVPTVVTQTNGALPDSLPLDMEVDGETIVSSSLRYISGQWKAALALASGGSVYVWTAAEADAGAVTQLPKILNSTVVGVALDASGIPWVVATGFDPYVRIFKYSNGEWVQVVQYLALTYPTLNGFGTSNNVVMHINSTGAIAAFATNSSGNPVFVYFDPVKNLTSAGAVKFQSVSGIPIASSYDLKVMPDGTVTFLRALAFYRGGNLIDLAVVDVATANPTPTPTPTPVPTPVPPLDPPPDYAQLAASYYQAGQSAFDTYSESGDYALAYFYGYSNFAQAAYYQNLPDSTAALVGYYYNMAIALYGYYANMGQPEFALNQYYSNMATVAALQEDVAGYYLYTANAVYYYYIVVGQPQVALQNYYLYMAASCYAAGSTDGYLYYIALAGSV